MPIVGDSDVAAALEADFATYRCIDARGDIVTRRPAASYAVPVDGPEMDLLAELQGVMEDGWISPVIEAGFFPDWGPPVTWRRWPEPVRPVALVFDRGALPAGVLEKRLGDLWGPLVRIVRDQLRLLPRARRWHRVTRRRRAGRTSCEASIRAGSSSTITTSTTEPAARFVSVNRSGIASAARLEAAEPCNICSLLQHAGTRRAVAGHDNEPASGFEGGLGQTSLVTSSWTHTRLPSRRSTRAGSGGSSSSVTFTVSPGWGSNDPSLARGPCEIQHSTTSAVSHSFGSKHRSASTGPRYRCPVGRREGRLPAWGFPPIGVAVRSRPCPDHACAFVGALRDLAHPGDHGPAGATRRRSRWPAEPASRCGNSRGRPVAARPRASSGDAPDPIWRGSKSMRSRLAPLPQDVLSTRSRRLRSNREMLAHAYWWGFERPTKTILRRLVVPSQPERERVEDVGLPGAARSCAGSRRTAGTALPRCRRYQSPRGGPERSPCSSLASSVGASKVALNTDRDATSGFGGEAALNPRGLQCRIAVVNVISAAVHSSQVRPAPARP